MPAEIIGGDAALVTPERNHYFYGKLMDVNQFNKEQLYSNAKRWLLNRLVLGRGVVSGLDVVPGPDPNSGMLLVQPGVAIDGLGREIVVPKTISVNPRKLTDDRGNPSGDAGAGITVVSLAYAEAQVDQVPVLVADCDAPGKCSCSTVREEFRILVRKEDQVQQNPVARMPDGFPLPASDALGKLLAQRVAQARVGGPADFSVPLARVNEKGALTPDSSLIRPLVYNNNLIYDLILSLSDRVSQLAHAKILLYESGDGQTAAPGEVLHVKVRLVDGAGAPLQGVVQFQVTEGGGSVASGTVDTSNEGIAKTRWTMGPGGPQQLTAAADGSALTVTFMATATK